MRPLRRTRDVCHRKRRRVRDKKPCTHESCDADATDDRRLQVSLSPSQNSNHRLGFPPSTLSWVSMVPENQTPSVSRICHPWAFLITSPTYLFSSCLRCARRINRISYMDVDKLASLKTHLSHRLWQFRQTNQPAGNGELRSDNENETGAFHFFDMHARAPEHSRLTCSYNHQIPLHNISKYPLNGHKA